MAAEARQLLWNLRNLMKVGASLASAGGGIIVLNASLCNVEAGQKAVVFDRFQGRATGRIVGEGTHFLVPWVQKPIIFSTRSTPKNVTAVANTKDSQSVQITVEISFRPDVRLLPQIYNNVGIDYAERLLPTLTTEVLESVVAQCDFMDFYKNALNIRQHISKDVMHRANSFGIIIDHVSLMDVKFLMRPNIK